MKRYLGMSRDEWLAEPWDMQRTYMEGLQAELEASGVLESAAGTEETGPLEPELPVVTRTADTGSEVIDLKAFAASFAQGS